MKPLSINILDADVLIKNNNIKEVSNHAIYEASTTTFHPQGLFSEEIFGRIGTPERGYTDGYIDLHTEILHPYVAEKLFEIKQLYKRIMVGKDYGRYDKTTKDIERCSESDEGAGTGFTWFMTNLKKVSLDINKTPSNKRKLKIKNLLKYRDLWFINKLIVLPAGLRDIEMEDKMLSKDDINNYYLTILSYAQRIPTTITDLTTLSLYDVVKTNLQLKVLDLYKYLSDILSGKNGRIDATIAHKNIVYGTRNVITAARHDIATMKQFDDTTPVSQDTEDTAIDFHTARIPCLQAAIGLSPFVIYYMKRLCFTDVFEGNNTTIPLLDKNTFELKYVEVDYDELQIYTTSEGLESLLNKLVNPHIRSLPAVCKGSDGKSYGFRLIYDTGDTIQIFSSIAAFKEQVTNGDRSKLRLMTWIEFIYICTYVASRGKHVDLTRYPIAGQGSTFANKVSIAATIPSRRVRMISSVEDPELSKGIILPAYPVLGEKITYVDAMAAHFGRLDGQVADHDGDTESANFVWDDESNAEIDANINSLAGVITPNKTLRFAPGKLDVSLFALTFAPDLDK